MLGSFEAGTIRRVLTFPEIHGLIVHLPVLAVPVVFVLGFLRWRGRGGEAVARAEPWAFGAAAVGSALAVVSGLAVLPGARTTLRGSAQTLVFVHLLLGVVLMLGFVGVAWYRWRRARQGGRPLAQRTVALTGMIGLLLVVVVGYVGGRMVYIHAVGIQSGGELAQSAHGAEVVSADLARGRSPVTVGKWAFQQGFGCSSCHGMRAQGGSGPGLSGGFDVRRFRHTHGTGLFPTSIVTAPMVASLEAWLRTKPSGISHGGE